MAWDAVGGVPAPAYDRVNISRKPQVALHDKQKKLN